MDGSGNLNSGTDCSVRRTGCAVVTDARLRTAVTVIRSLGRGGIRVSAAEARGLNRALGFQSRYARERVYLGENAHKTPDLQDLDMLLEACGPGGVIIPVHSPFVFMLSRKSHELRGRANFLVPDEAGLRLAHDKRDCFHLALSLGIPVPGTWVPREHGREPSSPDFEPWLASLELAYPVILKYRSGEDLWLSAAARTVKCSTLQETAEKYREMDALQPDPVIQEYIEGTDWGAALLYDGDSRLIASFTYRSIRERPPGRGPTVYAESVYKPELIEMSHRLLSSLEWKGMAMLDFRQGTDGTFRLLEVNPRFWGSLALAVQAGVDFPVLYYRAALGKLPGHGKQEDSQPVGTPICTPVYTELYTHGLPRQKSGVRIRFFPQDLLSVVDYARKDGRPVLRAITNEIREVIEHPSKDGLMDLTDPMPGLAYLLGGILSTRD